METDKKTAPWIIALVLLVAFGVPIVLGIVEVRVARNAHAESATIDYLRAVAAAENDYRKANDTFAAKLEDLKGLVNPERLYKIGYKPVTADSYIVMAWPTQPGKYGRRYFFMDQTGVVRYEIMHPAGPQSDVVPSTEKK